MKIFISGLPEQADAGRLRARMSELGPVEDVHVLQKTLGGDAVWVVVMDVDRGTANEIAQRIDDIWYQGRFIHAYVPLYQD